MKPTPRPQRTRLFRAAFFVAWLAFVVSIWGTTVASWTALPSASAAGTFGVGVMQREFGLLPYLVIASDGVDPQGRPVAPGAATVAHWRPLPLALALLATVLITPACWLAHRDAIARRAMPPPHCDGCGYDLSGCPGRPRRCPECGEPDARSTGLATGAAASG